MKTLFHRQLNRLAAAVVIVGYLSTLAAGALGAEASRRTDVVFSVLVRMADGTPVPNVTVVCVDPSTNVLVDGVKVSGGNARVRTDRDGRFRLAWFGTNLAVVVSTDYGFGLAQMKDFVTMPEIVVKPWAEIDGVRLNAGRPVTNQSLRYSFAAVFALAPELGQVVSFASNSTVTDARGHFTFGHVPPGPVTVSGQPFHPHRAYTFLQLVEVAPGTTNHVEIATQGRTVTGHFKVPPGITNQFSLADLPASLQPDLDVHTATRLPEVPIKFDTPDLRPVWWREWHQSAAGRLSDDVYSRLCGLEISADGRFTADFVGPGKYWLHGVYLQGSTAVVTVSAHIEVPAVSGPVGDAAVDLGEIPLEKGVNLPLGSKAPDFQAELLDGKGTFRLSDQRGKYVVLAFWATWSKPSLDDITYLVGVSRQFGTNKLFTMASLNLDTDREAARLKVRDEGMTWTQAYLGDWTRDKVASSYGILNVPQLVVIDPEGRIISGPHGAQLGLVLSQLFSKKAAEPTKGR